MVKQVNYWKYINNELVSLGIHTDFIKVEEDMGRYVWDERQKVEQKSRPLFMVLAK